MAVVIISKKIRISTGCVFLTSFTADAAAAAPDDDDDDDGLMMNDFGRSGL